MNHLQEAPEELLDVFKAAALSVTRLYKTSNAAQAKARVDGYQDCLEDLLAVVDKEGADMRTVRRWVADRMEGRDTTADSEDEADKADATSPAPDDAAAVDGRSSSSSSNSNAASGQNGGGSASNDTAMQTETDTPPPALPAQTPATAVSEAAQTASSPTKTAAAKPSKTQPQQTQRRPQTSAQESTSPLLLSDADDGYMEPVVVPQQDAFTFRSNMPYPTPESYMELAKLDLSDTLGPNMAQQQTDSSNTTSHANSNNNTTTNSTSTTSSPNQSYSVTKPFRVRHPSSRSAARSARHSRIASAAGQKRKLNFEEIFDLASLGYGKDVFGRPSNKRNRQA